MTIEPVSEHDERLVFLSSSKATRPPSGMLFHYTKRWWIVHPEKGLVFWRPNARMPRYSCPQCNDTKSLVKNLLERYKWADVQFHDSVFVPEE